MIPDGVASIGKCAFFDCSGLTSVTLPNSVTSIGDGAFFWCGNLASIKVDSGNTTYDSRDNCNAIIEANTKTLIKGCKNTFIPNSVTSIGDKAFAGCKGLVSVTIPDSVASIGDRAFECCEDLRSVTIPNSIKSIGKKAFYDTILYEVISMIENPFNITPYTFRENTWGTSGLYAALYVPVGTIEKYMATRGWKKFPRIEERN